jgi:ABC-2 type transport system ATP-binding protein
MQNISSRPHTTTNGAASAASNTKFAISTEKLNKSYGRSRGVIDLDLNIYEGEVFGFLGPNGAGKTTTIRLLLNLIKPTGGKASLLGMDSERDSVAIRKEVGYLPGEFSLYPGLTGAQTLEYFANLRDVDSKENWQRVQQMAERLELDLTKKFKQYSRGNKQKVGIIQALMHRPRLLILDEPTSGLDPLNQQEFYKLVEEARDNGATVFFSSHIMSEVEKICDRVGIIREGRLIKVGNIAELTGLKSHQLELTFSDSVPAQEFQNLPGVEQFRQEQNDGTTTLHFTVKAEALEQVVKSASKYQIINFVSREPSLEESFLHYYQDKDEGR